MEKETTRPLSSRSLMSRAIRIGRGRQAGAQRIAALPPAAEVGIAPGYPSRFGDLLPAIVIDAPDLLDIGAAQLIGARYQLRKARRGGELKQGERRPVQSEIEPFLQRRARSLAHAAGDIDRQVAERRKTVGNR